MSGSESPLDPVPDRPAEPNRRDEPKPVTIDVENLYRPFAEVREFLSAGYGDVTGVGLGFRWRLGKLALERTLRVMVRDKTPKGLAPSNGALLPERLRLRSVVLGKPLVVEVGLDVESMPRARPTWLRVGPIDGRVLTASTYAVWRRNNGHRAAGVVTAGHGLWRGTEHDQVIGACDVRLGQGEDAPIASCRVRKASHLSADHLDVGLLRLSREDAVRAPRLLGDDFEPAADLPGLLGNRQDALTLDASLDLEGARQSCRAIAYFEGIGVRVEGWGDVQLSAVVESLGEADTFVSGTSGGAIVGDGRTLGLGIQSMCLDPGDTDVERNTRSYATPFDHALRWLRDNVHPTLRFCGKIREEDLPSK